MLLPLVDLLIIMVWIDLRWLEQEQLSKRVDKLVTERARAFQFLYQLFFVQQILFLCILISTYSFLVLRNDNLDPFVLCREEQKNTRTQLLSKHHILVQKRSKNSGIWGLVMQSQAAPDVFSPPLLVLDLQNAAM